MPLKILYVGPLTRNDSALYRMWAIERAGHTIVPLDSSEYASKSKVLNRIAYRLDKSTGSGRLNRDLLRCAQESRPDLLWVDKQLFLEPKTLDQLRALGMVSVSYMIDNPFGTRGDRGWSLYLKCIPAYDLHVVQRDKNILDYRQHGARDVIKIQTAYEPTLHFPPPAGWSDADRNRDVSFIGTPYDDRAEVLRRLHKQEGFQVAVSGNAKHWRRELGEAGFAEVYRENEMYAEDYTNAIWRSKINLSFITHSNQDEFVHKSFEIAGCGGFLLAERSAGHSARFVEGEEAVFFEGFEDLASKIRRYLPDEAARSRIAAAGHARAVRDGYHNDRQVGLILERAEQILANRSTQGAP